MVVERRRHQFPQCCIWCSGAVAEGDLPRSPNEDGEVRPPMCPACTATRNRLPKSVGSLGLFTFIAAPFAYSSYGVPAAGALLLTGFIDLAIAWRLHLAAGGFQEVREDEQYVWIGGIHPDFLASLPPWSGMRLREIIRR